MTNRCLPFIGLVAGRQSQGRDEGCQRDPELPRLGDSGIEDSAGGHHSVPGHRVSQLVELVDRADDLTKQCAFLLLKLVPVKHG